MKKTMIIIGACLAVILAAGAAFASANGFFIPHDKADEWIAEQEAIKFAAMGKATPDPEEDLTLYEKSLLHASEEQKGRLVSIDTYGWEGVYPADMTKQILAVMGTIPEGMPCITLEQADEALASIDPAEYNYDLDKLDCVIASKFNEIAGAADIECGSGISHRIYFLNEEHTAFLDVSMSVVLYKAENKEQPVLYFRFDRS